jgi:hypothetical protein
MSHDVSAHEIEQEERPNYFLDEFHFISLITFRWKKIVVDRKSAMIDSLFGSAQGR